MRCLSKSLALSLLMSSLCVGAVWAQAAPPVHDHTASTVDKVKETMKVSISSDVQEDVDADIVRLTLSKQLEGGDQKALSDELNKAINSVIEKAKKDPAFVVQTGNYSFWANTGKNQSDWVVRGEVIITSKDFEKARALVGQTATDMNLDGINFSLSDAKRKESEDRLIEKAASAFRERAKSVSNAFGASDYTITRVNVQTSGVMGGNDMVYRAQAKGISSYSGEPVQLSSGKVTVNITTEGEIVLR